jgi:hypothetical protein
VLRPGSERVAHGTGGAAERERRAEPLGLCRLLRDVSAERAEPPSRERLEPVHGERRSSGAVRMSRSTLAQRFSVDTLTGVS